MKSNRAVYGELERRLKEADAMNKERRASANTPADSEVDEKNEGPGAAASRRTWSQWLWGGRAPPPKKTPSGPGQL